MKKIKFIDIFCGAGGLSYSFKKRNHDLKLAVDIDPISIKTLKTNFSQSSKYIFKLFFVYQVSAKTINLKMYTMTYNIFNLIILR